MTTATGKMGSAGISNPFSGGWKKPVPGDFTTHGDFGASNRMDAMRYRGQGDQRFGSAPGALPQEGNFDAFGYQKALDDHEFRQQLIKNMQETFPLDAGGGGAQASTGAVGPPPGTLDFSATPGPDVPSMAAVDYEAMGTDPAILDPDWWRKTYG
mgnify:CR=1 FL=1|tara:strand:+ start:1778 stop:2242 length:465 start_codon:yes stop_codon:yes gene_type:complete